MFSHDCAAVDYVGRARKGKAMLLGVDYSHPGKQEHIHIISTYSGNMGDRLKRLCGAWKHTTRLLGIAQTQMAKSLIQAKAKRDVR